MPLGNLTSQFFANVYLNELDYFVKHTLKARQYIRYVDDFVILHASKAQLEAWKEKINTFLQEKLKLQLHPQKSRIISLSKGIDFVGFRNHFHFKLLRLRSIRKMQRSILAFEKGELPYRFLMDSFVGWQGYAKWADTFHVRKRVLRKIAAVKRKKVEMLQKRKQEYLPPKTL